MKKIILIIVFLIAGGSTLADKLELDIYQSGMSHVREQLNKDIPRGKFEFIWEQEPSATVLRSLTFEEDFIEIDSISKSESKRSLVNILADNIGKNIEFAEKDGSIKGGLIISATPEIVVESNGKLRVLSIEQLRFSPEDRPSNHNELIISGQSKKKANQATANFLVNHLNWEAHYTLNFEENANVATLSSFAEVNNSSDIHYKNASITLALGGENYENYRYDNEVMYEAVSSKSYAKPEKIENLETYKIEIATNILPREMKRIGLFAEKEVQLKREMSYHNNANFSNDFNNKENLILEKYLTFKNPNEFLLPDGSIQVYTINKNKRHLLKWSNLNRTRPKDEVQLAIGRDFEISVDFEEEKRTEGGVEGQEYIELEYLLTIKNNSNNAITFRHYEHGTNNFEGSIKSSNLKYKKDGTSYSWEIKVPKKSKKVLKYTYKQAKRRKSDGYLIVR